MSSRLSLAMAKQRFLIPIRLIDFGEKTTTHSLVAGMRPKRFIQRKFVFDNDNR